MLRTAQLLLILTVSVNFAIDTIKPQTNSGDISQYLEKSQLRLSTRQVFNILKQQTKVSTGMALSARINSIADADRRKFLKSRQPELEKVMVETALLVYSQDNVDQMVDRAAKAYYDPEQAANAMKVFDKEIVKKIIEINKRDGGIEGQEKMQFFFASLQSSPPRTEVLDMVQEFLRITNQAGSAASIQANSIINQMKLMALVFEPQRLAELEDPGSELGLQFAQRKAQIIGQMMPQVEQQLVATFLFIFRDLSDEELQKYIEIHEMPGAQWNIDFTYKIFDKLFSESFLELRSKLSAKIKEILKAEEKVSDQETE